MLKQRLSTTMTAAALVMLTGCVMTRTAAIDPDFGAAVKHNIAIQTINPDAGPPDDSATMDAGKARQALEAYREEPEQISIESLIQNVGGN